jgi:hypothetical protein
MVYLRLVRKTPQLCREIYANSVRTELALISRARQEFDPRLLRPAA